MQTYPYLAITSGLTTCVIQDGAGGLTNYSLVRGGWAPEAPIVSDDELGGRGLYEMVEQELELNIYGASAAAAMANQRILKDLLDRAELWGRGDSVQPVYLQYAPQGSNVATTISPLTMPIAGRAPGDNTNSLGIPEQFPDVGMTYRIPGVRVRARCRAPWLLFAEDTASQVGTTNQVVQISMSPFLPSYAYGPTGVQIGQLLRYASAQQMSPAYLLIAKVETFGATGALINIANATTWTALGGGAALAASPIGLAGGAQIARAGNWSIPVASAIAARRSVALYAMIYVNGVTTITVNLTMVQGGQRVTVTQGLTYTFSGAAVRPIYLGRYSAPGIGAGVGRVELNIANSVANSLSIDHVAMIALDDPQSAVIALPNGLDRSVFSSDTNEIYLDPQWLTRPEPTLQHRSTATNDAYGLTYSGDLIAPTKDQGLCIALLAGCTNGSSTSFWRLTANGTTATSLTYTIRRPPAYAVPE